MALAYYGSISATGPTMATSGLYTSGIVYYVDYTNGSDSNSGLTDEAPLKTLAAAVTASTASNGNVIALMPGHAETLSSVQSFENGLTVVGLGTGSQMASFTNNVAGACFQCSGVGIEFRNLKFPVATNAASTSKILVNGAACRIIDCTFLSGANDGTSSTYLLNVTANYSLISGCTFTASALGAQGAIVYGSSADYFTLEDCTFDGGSVGWATTSTVRIATAGVGNYRLTGLTLSNASGIAAAINSEKGIAWNITVGDGCIIG